MTIIINNHFQTIFYLILLIIHQSFGLTIDGILLLSFKYSILNDPLHVLDTWNVLDETPCSWNGILCESTLTDIYVTGLSLPNSKLHGSMPENLGLIQHLKEIDLSNNSINGTIPLSLYSAPKLQLLDLSSNFISGDIFLFVGGWQSLRILNVSGNLLTGKLPESLALLPNLTIVSLQGNYFHGELSSGFDSVKVFDISYNFINGSLPADNFGNGDLEYFNVSHNNISGEIPSGFVKNVATNVTIDLSFNNLTGAIPESSVFFNQDEVSFAGNPGLCGKPLKLCVIPSSVSTVGTPF